VGAQGEDDGSDSDKEDLPPTIETEFLYRRLNNEYNMYNDTYNILFLFSSYSMYIIL